MAPGRNIVSPTRFSVFEFVGQHTANAALRHEAAPPRAPKHLLQARFSRPIRAQLVRSGRMGQSVHDFVLELRDEPTIVSDFREFPF